MNYIVVDAKNAKELNEKVNFYLTEGYVIWGALQVVGGILYQAVISQHFRVREDEDGLTEV
jgi:hypothetical protein